MTLQKDQPKPRQTRAQRIIMWSVFGVAAVMLTIAIVLLIVSGTRLF